MASSAVVPFISVEEYRRGHYKPDVDYVDGVLEERNLGELEHSSLQRFFITLFWQQRKEWQTDTYPELRVRVAAKRFRVPDLCVMRLGWQKTAVVEQPPLLCIEILSPEDTLPRQRKRAQDYLAMGVPEVWIFDPRRRNAFVMRGDEFLEQHEGKLRLAGTPVEVSLADVFAALDE